MGQLRIYGFSLPRSYTMDPVLCSHAGDCHIFQAREKTVFMIIMLSVALLSALLTLVELVSSRFTKQDI